VIKEIGDQAKKDLGFRAQMQAVDQATQIQRILTQQKSFDINQSDNSTIRYVEHAGVFKPIPVKDYKLWDKTLSMFTTGKFSSGKPIPREGLSPMMTGFWSGADGKKFSWGHACEMSS
jgi:putative spermidine/putrescine transport system substrate-binding protein